MMLAKTGKSSWAFCITLHEVMIDELIGDEDRGFLVNENIPRTCTLTN